MCCGAGMNSRTPYTLLTIEIFSGTHQTLQNNHAQSTFYLTQSIEVIIKSSFADFCSTCEGKWELKTCLRVYDATQIIGKHLLPLKCSTITAAGVCRTLSIRDTVLNNKNGFYLYCTFKEFQRSKIQGLYISHHRRADQRVSKYLWTLRVQHIKINSTAKHLEEQHLHTHTPTQRHVHRQVSTSAISISLPPHRHRRDPTSLTCPQSTD